MSNRQRIIDHTFIIWNLSGNGRRWEAIDVTLDAEEHGESVTYLLEWWDGNDKYLIERFPVLSHALLRMAALIACGEHGWVKAFAQDGDGFRAVAGQILNDLID